MKLKEIHRTSTFAWSPYPGLPLVASGTVSGALDASFSNDSQLEIWDPNLLDKHSYDIGAEGLQGPQGVLTTSSRFNRLVWGNVTATRPKGVIAAGMENGELSLWDAEKIIENAEASAALIARNTNHTGPVRALDFNSFQTHLLSSGAVNGEIYIWDLNDPSKPYSPGARSAKLEDVTSVAWNSQVAHILASSSNSGYTAVWDLRGKREVVALAYGGGAATAGGPAGGAFATGGRRGMSDVAWHPDNATRLVTSSEDDSSPIIMSWDLRNARAPEKILTGHDKGVLSLSWCRQDADLLLSCGKDNRTLCWNPQTAELIGDLQAATNWAFQVQWCPRNPNLLATASFDGRIGIHSLQSTNEAEIASENRTPQPEGADIFDQGNFGLQAQQQPTLSLKQPPKWLRRPVSATFGFGGQLISVTNQPSAQGAPQQTGSVHIRKFATEPSIVERAEKLKEAAEGQKLNEFAEQKSQDTQGETALEGWKALTSLFRANTRDELVTLLGFSKESIAANVQEAIKKVKASAAAGSQIATPSAPSTNVIPPEPQEEDVTESKPYEPVVSFAEPEREPEPLSEPTEGPPADADTTISGSGPIEATPSEVSASATSDATKAQEADSTATEPSLFGDDVNIGTPQGDANADFFATIGTVRSALPGHVLVPHHSYAADSSVAATIGSRPSSAASDTLKTTTFKIYPNEESEVDRLLTKSLVLGDFESAVSLCLSVERYADAILLAVKGGPELLQKTQTAYFTKQTTSLPYLRLYQSIVSNDLDDIVQNADLREWQEIFVILCTFAKEDEFSGLAKQLGQRLEFQGKVVKAADPQNSQVLAKEYRRNATLCYLAAGKLEQIVHIWIEEMKEEEAVTVASGDEQHGVSRYTSHALALQTFIEKVAVFRGATKYVDADLQQQDKGTEGGAGVRSYKLATLYDRYFEYADLLAAQGMLPEAVKYLAMTPAEYKGSQGGLELDFEHARKRVLRATGAAATPVAPASQVTTQQTTHQRPPVSTYPATQHPYGVQPAPYGVQPAQNTYAPPAPQQQPPVKPSPYSVYAPPNGTSAPATQPAPAVNDPYAPAGGTQTQPQQPAYRPTQPYAGNTGYGGGYGGQTYGQQPGIVPPPGPQAPPPPRAPPKRTDEGWNDTPLVDAAARRGTPSQKPPSLQAITSPFPNAQPGSSPNSPYAQSSQGLPPPPRTGMSPSQMHPPQQGHMAPPPPRGGSALAMGRPPPGQQGQPIPPPPGRAGPGGPPPFGRPASTGPGGPPPANYPGRSLSPLSRAGGGYPQDRAMSPLAQGGPPARQTQSHFAGPPPSQQQPGMHPPPPGPGSAPPIRGPGPYGPPTGAQPIPVQQPQQPPPPPGPYGQPRGPAPPGPPPPGQAYAPGPGGPRGPPPMAGGQLPPPGPPQPGVQPPPGPGGSQPPPPKPAAPAPKAPKYPPGDRSHIPDNAKVSYSILNDALNRLRQTTPPQQKRLVDDTERRLNHLFDALNCETLPPSLVDQLNTLTQAMAARDQQTALATHVDMLTTATGTEDIALWMSGVKQLILRA